MAIQFNGNKTILNRLGNLHKGDTFMYEGRIGLVVMVEVWLDDGYEKETQRFFIDLVKGKEFYTNQGDLIQDSDYVTPVNIKAEII